MIEIIETKKGNWLKSGEISIPIYDDIDRIKTGLLNDNIPFWSKDNSLATRGKDRVVILTKSGIHTVIWEGQDWEVTVLVKLKSVKRMFEDAGVNVIACNK